MGEVADIGDFVGLESEVGEELLRVTWGGGVGGVDGLVLLVLGEFGIGGEKEVGVEELEFDGIGTGEQGLSCEVECAVDVAVVIDAYFRDDVGFGVRAAKLGLNGFIAEGEGVGVAGLDFGAGVVNGFGEFEVVGFIDIDDGAGLRLNGAAVVAKEGVGVVIGREEEGLTGDGDEGAVEHVDGWEILAAVDVVGLVVFEDVGIGAGECFHPEGMVLADGVNGLDGIALGGLEFDEGAIEHAGLAEGDVAVEDEDVIELGIEFRFEFMQGVAGGGINGGGIGGE